MKLQAMVTPQLLFRVGNLLAMLCWLTLLVSLIAPRTRPRGWAAAGTAIPVLFAIAYIPLVIAGLRTATGGGFSSIAQVRALFATDAGLVAGWLHYLAFDLFVGTWITREGLAADVPRLLLAPCLLLTFLFGPAGLLLFLVLRAISSRLPSLELAR